jgi:hypothetical protein
MSSCNIHDVRPTPGVGLREGDSEGRGGGEAGGHVLLWVSVSLVDDSSAVSAARAASGYVAFPDVDVREVHASDTTEGERQGQRLNVTTR